MRLRSGKIYVVGIELNDGTVSTKNIQLVIIEQPRCLSRFSNALDIKNAHPRDKNIEFYSQNHVYNVYGLPEAIGQPVTYTRFISVTQWNHFNFTPFDADIAVNIMSKTKRQLQYKGLTNDQVKAIWETANKKATINGTLIHKYIEKFMNLTNYVGTHKDLYEQYLTLPEDEKRLLDSSVEFKYFLNFVKDFPDLKPYRTEWSIYDEEFKIAGTLDIVYENADGTLDLYDWKTCKAIERFNPVNDFGLFKAICHLPNADYWKHALQLNMYKYILEKHYGKTVRDQFVVRLNANATNYERIPVRDLSMEIKDLLIERKI